MLAGEHNYVITSELANQGTPKALFTCVIILINVVCALYHQSLEEKYNAQKKMTQALEAYILDAQAVEIARKEKIASETLQSQ